MTEVTRMRRLSFKRKDIVYKNRHVLQELKNTKMQV